MDGGYIKLHRSLLNWEWFSESKTTLLWIYILLNACYEDTKFKGEDIAKGSFSTQYWKICKDTGLTIQEVRTGLKRLESTGEINRKITGKQQVITVENWALYQYDVSQLNSNLTGCQQHEEEYKEIKNKEIYINNNNTHKGFKKPSVCEVQEYIAEKGYHFDAEAFVAFYESNGWKVGKNTMKSWKGACTTWEKRYNPVGDYF